MKIGDKIRSTNGLEIEIVSGPYNSIAEMYEAVQGVAVLQSTQGENQDERANSIQTVDVGNISNASQPASKRMVCISGVGPYRGLSLVNSDFRNRLKEKKQLKTHHYFGMLAILVVGYFVGAAWPAWGAPVIAKAKSL